MLRRLADLALDHPRRVLLATAALFAIAVVFGGPMLESGVDEDATVKRLVDRFEDRPGLSLGGEALAFDAIGEQVQEDLARAEMIAFPILFVLALWVFRGVVAALLPLFVGLLTIFGTFLALRLVNEVTLLSIFALNLA